ncbi:DUF3181 family protein [Baaleninema simplex]|uniref:DUF3181 family protein n=1 Tax=Baaleninema simplex TaxID=2862350 RepID=UPI0003466145|nr:DUF3181 family protein [Baaleninema simplex]
MATTREIETLAAEIADKIYIDVAKWHLYLGDAHLHIPLAERFYPMLENDDLSDANVQTVLQNISVPLGGGRTEVSLLDLLPATCQSQLVELLEDYQKENL